MNSQRTKLKKKISMILSPVAVLSTMGFIFVISRRDESMRVGFVQSSTILSLFPAAQTAQAHLDSLVQEWSDTLNEMSKEYRAEVTRFTEQSGTMTAMEKTMAQAEVDSLRQEILAYRQAKLQQGGELDEVSDSLMAPIRKEIHKEISEIAKERGMDFVLDKNYQNPIVLYADPKYDITYEVLDALNRQEAN